MVAGVTPTQAQIVLTGWVITSMDSTNYTTWVWNISCSINTIWKCTLLLFGKKFCPSTIGRSQLKLLHFFTTILKLQSFWEGHLASLSMSPVHLMKFMSHQWCGKIKYNIFFCGGFSTLEGVSDSLPIRKC